MVPFELLGERSQDVFWLADLTQQELLHVNASFERIWGLPAAALLADPACWNASISPHDLPPDDPTRQLPFFAMPVEAEQSREYRVRHADGSVRWVRDRRFALSDPITGQQQVGGIVQDITVEKQAELEHSGRLELACLTRDEALALTREQDQFAALVSHELRSPLSTIRGWTHLLRRAGDLTAMQARAVEVIERSVQTQAALLDDLRDHRALLIPSPALQAEPCDPLNLLQEALGRVQAGTRLKRLHVDLHAGAGVGVVHVSSHAVVRALAGLLTHLVSLAQEDGWLSATIERCRGTERGDHIRIDVNCGAVRPQGIRMPQEPSGVPTLSQKSQRLAVEMARRVLAAHGGRLAALQDADPAALAFCVELPPQEAEARMSRPVPLES